MSIAEEQFDVIDLEGKVVGRAPRSRCHGDPSLIHRAVHVVVFDRAGRLFLQRRSMRKDVAPGRWDTSVGGHLQPGETPQQGALRELREELGIEATGLEVAYDYLWRSPIETEWIHAFLLRHDGPFTLQREEIDEGRFWSTADIQAALGSDIFTPQFEQEYPRMLAARDRTSP